MENASDRGDDSDGRQALLGEDHVPVVSPTDQDAVTTIHHCYCPNCEESEAVTTLLPTSIPFFREIIIMALSCPVCHFRHSSVTFGGKLQEQGVRIRLQVRANSDLNRCIVKSDSATLLVVFPNRKNCDYNGETRTKNIDHPDSGVVDDPEEVRPLEFEIPATTQQGTVAPLEGIMARAASNLEAQQPERLRLGDLDNFYRCKTVIERLRYSCHDDTGGEEAAEGNDKRDDQGDETEYCSHRADQRFPFEVVLDDPAGNSFIESPMAPAKDYDLSIEYYTRSPAQDMSLGIQPSQGGRDSRVVEVTNIEQDSIVNDFDNNQSRIISPNTVSPLNSGDCTGADKNAVEDALSKSATFSTPCPNCQERAETNMHVTHIPHFKEIIIMSLVCDSCGYRNSDIKAGGSIAAHGTKTTLIIRFEEDLQRELLLSDTAGIEIPEIELELGEGGGLGGGGAYTTVEGLLRKLLGRLKEVNPFAFGDAAEKHHLTNDGGDFSATPMHFKYRDFLAKLNDICDGQIMPVTLVLKDPLSNSFIGPLPRDARKLSEQARKEGSSDCYPSHVDKGLIVQVFYRTFEQNEALGLNCLKTEKYAANLDTDYGTDQMEENPAGSSYTPVGPDHPHEAANTTDKKIMTAT